MGSLLIRAFDARRQPLPDRMDVRFQNARSNASVFEVLDAAGTTTVVADDLIDHQPYIVTVRSNRHRPVSQFAIPRPGAPVEVSLYAPLDAAKARATFPAYIDLVRIAPDLKAVLHGQAWELFSDPQKAGLFNVYAKMASLGLWQAVERITAVQPDRILCDVRNAFLADARFVPVSGSLHDPPEGFHCYHSWKTLEPYGNLQLTYFTSDAPPLRFKLDADIDDAAGLGHVFQVVGHWLTNGKTHPYDIHEILTFSQALVLPYTLA